MIIAFNKPFGVLSQFTPDRPGQATLAKYGFPKGVYPLGRLDSDSEGLLLLSNETELNSRLLDPGQGHLRTYWAQVENIPGPGELAKLQCGVVIKNRRTLPCLANIINPQPQVEEREPPIRFRKSIPTCWIEISLKEGKNRQVRRMTAAVGFPTLRLIRVSIGTFSLGSLAPGRWKELGAEDRSRILAK